MLISLAARRNPRNSFVKRPRLLMEIRWLNSINYFRLQLRINSKIRNENWLYFALQDFQIMHGQTQISIRVSYMNSVTFLATSQDFQTTVRSTLLKFLLRF